MLATKARPLTRHAASLVYSGVLRVALGFRGTDTHGLKAFRRQRLKVVVDSCLVDKDVFASELVLRAERAGLRVVEIPVQVMEKRLVVRRLPLGGRATTAVLRGADLRAGGCRQVRRPLDGGQREYFRRQRAAHYAAHQPIACGL